MRPVRVGMALWIFGAMAPGMAQAGKFQVEKPVVGDFRVVGLTTEHRVNPIGIGEPAPLLAWKLEGGRPLPEAQQAYQIRSARSIDGLDSPKDLLWDSGRVNSSRTHQVLWSGPQLKARQTVVWQVRVWDQSGRVSPWSRPATFELGLLAPGDWSAQWIEHPTYSYQQPDGKESPLPIFARNIPVSGKVASARLYVTGLGMYAADLNGKPLTDHVLEPGQTTYSAEVHYRTYDLTRQLRSGDNVLRLETGSGAYQRVVTPGRFFFGGRLEEFTTYGKPKVLAQLEITYADGRRVSVGTDASWRTALGATTFSSWWSGEEYDARRSTSRFPSASDLTGPDWRAATPAVLTGQTTPRGSTPLRSDPRPPVLVAESLRPVAIRSLKAGSYVLDFGANRSGWPRVQLSGPAGTTVTMIPSEQVNADGTLNLRSTGASAERQIAYRYTLSGRGTETWHPRFTYSGFRYLQVEGLPTPPRPDTIQMDAIYASNPVASSFESSSDLLRQIRQMSLRATQSNMTSVLTDCPNREKGPYTGDNLHNLDALLTDYQMAAYQPQLVHNMATAQRQPGDVEPGLIANIAPEFHRVRPVKINRPQGVIEFLDEVNWGGAIIRIPWKLYEVYGDTRTMSRYYPNMVAWLDYVAASKAANKGDIPGLGDWSATDNSTPMQLAIVAGHYAAARDMTRIAALLRKPQDQRRYAALATDLAVEFTRRFRHTDANGVYYGSDSEASNAMALDAGLVLPADRPSVVQRLVAAVRKAGNHITTGSVGLGPLFRALEAAGRHDVIYEMVINPTSPGYGYLVASGRTTLTESLDGGGSQNHHFLGQVNAWMISGVAGIRQAPESTSYRNLEIAPALVGDLTHAEGRYESPYGTIKSAWSRTSGGGLILAVTVPPLSTATVRVPAGVGARIKATSSARLAPGQRDSTSASYTVGPGRHRFEVTP